ncbi:response regulator [bacterium]|nr:response regulator [bacterium]
MSNNMRRVAVVDDEESVRKALSRLLRSAGFEVEAFASGTEYLNSLQVEKPDCLVIDLHMPVLNGLDVLNKMSEQNIKIPAIIITGFDGVGMTQRVISAGALTCLHKPVDDELLISALMSCTEK